MRPDFPVRSDVPGTLNNIHYEDYFDNSNDSIESTLIIYELLCNSITVIKDIMSD